MKKRTIIKILIVCIALSFISNVKAQLPYSLQLDSIFIYQWDNSSQDWFLSQKEIYRYIYDQDNRLLEINQYDILGNLIRIESRVYTENTMERILKIPYYGSWVNWRKYFTLYDDVHKEVYSETYIWENNEWIRKDKVLWQYDDDHLIRLIRQYLFNGLFQDVEQIDYLYDSDFRLKEYLITNIITSTPISRILYSYNDLNQRTEGLQQSWLSGDWVITGKLLYKYNQCGTLQWVISQNYLNSDFINASKSEFFYFPQILELSLKKIPVCHKGHTIYISINALKAHLAHGDCIGECTITKTPERRYCGEYNRYEKPPFKIYPNPANEKITIKFNKEEFINKMKRVELTDFYGKLIKTYQINSNNDFEVYRGNLPAGKYYIRLVGKKIFSQVVIFE